jgi:glutamyl-tRNA synthetase
MQANGDAELARSFQVELENHTDIPVDKRSTDYVEKVVGLIKERATFVSDFWELSDYFFLSPADYNEKAAKKQWKEGTSEIMTQLSEVLKTQVDFTSETLESNVKSWITEEGLSFGKVMPPLRLVLVGDMKGPHIFDIMAMIGKEETLSRIEKAIAVLG